ncbi:MAG TPA: adenylosuccinate lyase [Gammaproteobacteria bacterium]|nr:adenylosuccinate lyase [Gammaproteobacteria bacterium]|tara:strand:- start:802 stop:2202 length:1401 start_codon:yes stop_codon:yes gene_type:complete
MPVKTDYLPPSPLTAVSPIDGRYANQTKELVAICSEFGLIRYRTIVEIRWLQHLAAQEEIQELPGFDPPSIAHLEAIIHNFGLRDAERIKAIEKTTNHDVKAVEYFLQEKCRQFDSLKEAISFLHFACTSEDINNLAYAMMVKEARDRVLVPRFEIVKNQLSALADSCGEYPMLARTHGQMASPTTMAKEIVNVIARIERQMKQLSRADLLGKFNGAVGNFNAHLAAFPDADWPKISASFVNQLGLTPNYLTTQIEPHDYLAEIFDIICRLNTILIDFCRDTWGYISIGYFRQKSNVGEVGSSTMPHKVNPIDFENGEGNFGVANALMQHLSAKLPISRWQRDLTDSTVLRNIGPAFGHTVIALAACERGIAKLKPDFARQAADLADAWEILAEPIQTVMRRYGVANSYEILKDLTRGTRVDRATLHKFIDTLALPEEERVRLKGLTPDSYIGVASQLAKSFKSPH